MKVFKYSSIAIVLVVPLFLMMGCAGASWSFSDMLPGNGPKTVGADVKMEDITAVAVTYGPGLAGSLIVGVEAAKTLAMIYNKPLIDFHPFFLS